MKFKDFKIGDYIIWLYDNDVGIIKEIDSKKKKFYIHWYKSKFPKYTHAYYYNSNRQPLLTLDKSYYFDKDMKEFLG